MRLTEIPGVYTGSDVTLELELDGALAGIEILA